MTPEQSQAIKARRDASKQPPWFMYEGNAPADVDALLAEVERLRAEVTVLRALLDMPEPPPGPRAAPSPQPA